MGTAKYTIEVKFPDSTPAVGVAIEGVNRDAWSGSASDWSGTTTENGRHTWEHIDTGLNGDKYDFYCRYVDPDGVEWKAETSDRIFTSEVEVLKKVTLRQVFLDEDLEFSLPYQIEENIKKTDSGRELQAAIKEMGMAIKQGMSHSALALSTYIIEGMIITIAKRKKIWKEEWKKHSFGKLINEPEIVTLIPDGELDRLKALNQLRIPGVHFKGGSSVIEEAIVGKRLIIGLAKVWFSRASN